MDSLNSFQPYSTWYTRATSRQTDMTKLIGAFSCTLLAYAPEINNNGNIGRCFSDCCRPGRFRVVVGGGLQLCLGEGNACGSGSLQLCFGEAYSCVSGRLRVVVAGDLHLSFGRLTVVAR
jgi:hypothetical protein